jgi:diguanylate cyclase (GGDEF)-like protein
VGSNPTAGTRGNIDGLKVSWACRRYTWVKVLTQRAASWAATALLVASAVGLLVLLVQLELDSGPMRVNWLVFAAISAVLLAGELSERWWITTGDVGVVTPRWMATFALLLVSTPVLALAAALTAAVVTSRRHEESTNRTVTRLSTTAIATGIAGLTLRVAGIEGSITQYSEVGWGAGIAIVAAGASILLTNSITGAFRIWATDAAPLPVAAAAELRGHVAADAALLSLAPIWVIGVSYSLVLIPLLAVTSLFVFRSTRQAFDRTHDARHDALTGLLNQRAFRSEVEARCGRRSGRDPTAVTLLDLDGFKDINDRLGHAVGDQVLRAFAQRARHMFPPNTVLARLGGDEFAALLQPEPGEPSPDPARIAAIHHGLSEPLEVDGFPIRVGVSLGVAVASPALADTDDLMHAADAAMYRAKRRRTNVEFHGTGDAGHGRVRLLSELGAALEARQLTVHFQPQFRIATGEVTGVEALVRWRHPQHGFVPPDEFIGMVERTELIEPLTEFVLRLAGAGALRWRDAHVRLAVNVSARSLLDPAFAGRVLDVISEVRLPPSQLELEVTERALVTEPERSQVTIAELRATGVQIAIDDFGSGYSSYQTLRDLDVDRVKIDRVFVAGMLSNHRDQAIVQSVVNLAHRLGVEVVGEGVESVPIWNALAAVGCDVAQGFGIARPMPLADLRGWLTRWDEAREATRRPGAAERVRAAFDLPVRRR